MRVSIKIKQVIIIYLIFLRSIDTDEMPIISAGILQEEQIGEEDEESLVKESCHDSGIDIRESSQPPIVAVQTKKVSR